VNDEDGAQPGVVYTPLPDPLVDLPPGPQLFALLTGVDRSACNGYQLVQVMAARARMVSWLQAQLLLDAGEIARAQTKGPEAAPVRSTQTDPYAPDEIACALGWSTYAAEEFLGVSAYLARYTPALFDALAAGVVDLYKVKLILKELQFLDADAACRVIDRLLDGIAGRPPETIRDQARSLALSHDPNAARKRYDRSVAQRHVTLRAQPDGTATLTARHLPSDKATAAYDYLNRLAAATKKAGDPNQHTHPEEPRTDPAGPSEPTNQPGTSEPGPSEPGPSEPGPSEPGTNQPSTEQPSTDRPGTDKRRIDQLRADILLDLLAGADPTLPASQGGAGAVAPVPRPGTVNLTVDLTALLCLNDHPAELAGSSANTACTADPPPTRSPTSAPATGPANSRPAAARPTSAKPTTSSTGPRAASATRTTTKPHANDITWPKPPAGSKPTASTTGCSGSAHAA
jgi:hypothetical protein